MPEPTSFLAPDHPLRFKLANSMHARPSDALKTLSRATFVAVLTDPADLERELQHRATL